MQERVVESLQWGHWRAGKRGAAKPRWTAQEGEGRSGGVQTQTCSWWRHLVCPPPASSEVQRPLGSGVKGEGLRRRRLRRAMSENGRASQLGQLWGPLEHRRAQAGLRGTACTVEIPPSRTQDKSRGGGRCSWLVTGRVTVRRTRMIHNRNASCLFSSYSGQHIGTVCPLFHLIPKRILLGWVLLPRFYREEKRIEVMWHGQGHAASGRAGLKPWSVSVP